MNIENNLANLLDQLYSKGYTFTSFNDSLPLIYKNAFIIYKLVRNNDQLVIIDIHDNSSMDLLINLYGYLRNIYDSSFIYISKKMESLYKEKIDYIYQNKINYMKYDSSIFYNSNKVVFLDNPSNNSLFQKLYNKSTQLLVKFYLFNKVKSYTSRFIADQLNISASTVSRNNDILYKFGVLIKEGYGHLVTYRIKSKKILLNKLNNVFIRPYDIFKYHMLLDDEHIYLVKGLTVSGESAISEYTSLTSSRLIYAAKKEKAKEVYENYLKCQITKPSYFVTIESYVYDPNLFSKDGLIDLFDAYVYLLKEEDIDDPRVHQAYSSIKEQLEHERQRV